MTETIRVAVTSIGAPLHAQHFVQNLDGKDPNYTFEFIPVRPQVGYGYVDWKKYDVLWNVGFYLSGGVTNAISQIRKLNPKIKIINVWAGTDILEVQSWRRQRSASPTALRALFRPINLHVTDGTVFQKEVRQFGVEALYVSSCPEASMSLTPLPRKFCVAVYMPVERLNFYQYKLVEAVALDWSRTNFYLFPSHAGNPLTTIPSHPQNIHFMKFVEGEEKAAWWARCSVLIVIPMHGSVSVTAIEFMQMGRAVIINQDLPFMICADTLDAIDLALRNVRKRKRPDKQASEYYHEAYSHETQLKYAVEALKAVF